MIEIDIHGRRGQGAEIAGQLLARAFSRRYEAVRTSTIYDGVDRQAQVIAALWVDASPVRGRGATRDTRHHIVLDPALLAAMPRDRVDGIVLIISPTSPCSRLLGAARIIAVDANAIAPDGGFEAAVAGAFAGVTGLLSVEEIVAALPEGGGARRKHECVEAVRLAFREASETAGFELARAS
jgi:pyruvate ferredoxin oxidoreductase gamma subunit